VSMFVNAIAAAEDVLITADLCMFFQNFHTSFQRPDTVPDKLIPFTISNGLLTSICAVISFISISVWPDTFIYFVFYVCLGRLCQPECYSLLVILNACRGLHSHYLLISLQGIEHLAHVQFADHNNISIKFDALRQFAQNEVGFSLRSSFWYRAGD
ncbi:uncharacterized protein F5147DRAFT_585749, partial [Suillus discolor]